MFYYLNEFINLFPHEYTIPIRKYPFFASHIFEKKTKHLI